MSESQQMVEPRKGGRPSRSIEEEIEVTRTKLRELEDRQRRDAKAKAEKNSKAVSDLLRARKLDQVPIEIWRAKLSEIATVLA
jgi:Spy/CpxP family protein refolding chaperone